MIILTPLETVPYIPFVRLIFPLHFFVFFVYTTSGMKNDKAFDHHAIAPPQKVQTVDSIKKKKNIIYVNL